MPRIPACLLARCGAFPRRLLLFRARETGGMTLDSVVVTAGAVGLGFAVLTTLADGVIDATAALETDIMETVDRDTGGSGTEGGADADETAEEDEAGGTTGGDGDAGAGGGDDDGWRAAIRRFLRWLFGG